MPDIEDSLRRYADALERSASMPAPAPRRRRGIVLALVAAIGVLAIATTAVVITRDDGPSHVRTVNSSSTTSRTAFDPTRCTPRPHGPVDFEIFLAPEATAQQVAGVKAALTTAAGVDSFRHLSKADAYREFIRLFRREQPNLVTTISPADLPESFRVKARPRQARPVLAEIRKLPGVKSVDGPAGTRCPTTTTTTTAPRDPNVWVTAKIHLDKTTFAPGEDVTGEIVFTNHLPTDAVLADDRGCLTGWQAAVARGNARITALFALVCRSAPSGSPERVEGNLAFRPGTSTVRFAVPSTYGVCTSNAPQPDIPKCLRGHMPPLPPGPARLGIAVSPSNAHFSVPAPLRITLRPLGSRLPFCTAAQLAAHENTVAATIQQPRALFVVKNTSQKTCQVDGYPSVDLRGANGYIPVSIDHGSHLPFPAVRPRSVPLRPGAVASFDLGYSTHEPGDGGGACTQQAATIHILLPDGGGAINAPTTIAPCVIGSAGSRNAANLTMSPFVSGRARADR